MKYRPDIDGLRAVAVLPVVLYHAGLPGMTGGFLGVDVFFVISGFLISSIVASEVREGRFSLLSFYERRARRILPALTVVVLSTFAVGWFVLLPGEFRDLGGSALATALFLSNAYFTLKLDYFAPAAEFAPLLHTWSLAVEEQFYLFYPPMLALLFTRWGLRAAFWAVLGLSILSLLAAVIALPSKPDWVFYLIFFRAWELGVGALLALCAIPSLRNRFLREIVGAAGLLAILVPVVVYDTQTPFPGLTALPPVLGAAAIIYVGADGIGSLVNRLLSKRFFVWVGLISYSLYLWHWPILAFLRIGRADVSLPLTIGLMAVVVSVIISWISYRFIEHPFRAKPPQGFTRRAIFSLSGVALSAMILIGGLLHVSHGMPMRLDLQTLAIAGVSEDRNPDRDACFNRLPKDGLCSMGVPVGDGEPVDFLFWGDSHAEAMKYGLDLAAQAQGESGLVAVAAACPPIRTLQRSPELRKCTQMNEDVWDFLQERPDISVVILHARWILSVEGTRYRNEAGGPVDLVWSKDADTRPPTDDNATLLEYGLKSTIAEIVATGRKVIILGPVPEAGWDLPNAMARAEMLGRFVEKPTITYADFESRAARTEELLSRAAATSASATYIPLGDMICSEESCSLTDADGLPLFVDDDHISRTTAERLLPQRLAEIWATNGQ